MSKYLDEFKLEVIKHPEEVNIRSELMQDSSIAECEPLKLRKITDLES